MTLMITVTKFMFICVWKSIQVMMDDFLGRVITIEVIFFSFYFMSIGPPLEKTQNLAFCTGNFQDIGNTKEWEWHRIHPYYRLIFFTCVIQILILAIIIKFKKHKISAGKPVGLVQAPKDLESTFFSLVLLIIIMISVGSYLLYWMQ